MKKINKKYLLYMFLFSFIYGNIIVHESIVSSDYKVPISIRAFLTIDDVDVYRFSLLFRSSGNSEYIEVPMVNIGRSLYQAEIPGGFCIKEYMEYYLLLEMHHYAQIRFPSIDAHQNPIKIQIDLPDNYIDDENLSYSSNINKINNYGIIGLEPDYMILSPKPNERLFRNNFIIALSYYKMNSVDYSKIKIYLDEKDITDRANIDSSYITFTSNSIMPGIHNISVKLTNTLGQKYNDINWSFEVLPSELKSYGYLKKQSSKIRINYNERNSDVNSNNISDLQYKHELEYDWLNIKAMFYKSNLENKNSQPYDRYLIKFKNNIFEIKLGDSFPDIDYAAWNGKRIRGVNFSILKKPFRLNYIKGITARAIQGDPNNAMVISEIDSSSSNWNIIVNRDNYTFQQDVSALKFGLKYDYFKFNINYIRVSDNLPTVASEVINSRIKLPNVLDDLLINNESNIILLEDLKETIPDNMTLTIQDSNWIGAKPMDNYILSSNFQFGLDESRIIISNRFSMSFLNRNQWTSFKDISQLDTLAYDLDIEDNYFLETIEIDTSFSISKYDNYISFGQSGQPLVPFIMQNKSLKLNEMLNLSNLNRLLKIEFRYFGHHIQLGSKRVGPDYYSVLNSGLKTNYKETFLSDKFNMFDNKLFFFYKRSRIIENLYSEVIIPVETKKSIFNIGLFPGNDLPTFNFNFHQYNRFNDVQSSKIVSDTLWNNDNSIDRIVTEVIDNRINLKSRQYNISMSNKFKFWFDQLIAFNILFFEQNDEISEDISIDSLLSLDYFPKNAISESYGLSIKTTYNNHWGSMINFNRSDYDYGINTLDYDSDDQIDNFKQTVINYQTKITYNPPELIKQIVYGMNYSIGRGNSYYTQYNINIGISSEPIKDFFVKMLLDYRINYLGAQLKSPNDLFFRVQILYDII